MLAPITPAPMTIASYVWFIVLLKLLDYSLHTLPYILHTRCEFNPAKNFTLDLLFVIAGLKKRERDILKTCLAKHMNGSVSLAALLTHRISAISFWRPKHCFNWNLPVCFGP